MKGSEIRFYADRDDFHGLLSAINYLHCYEFTSTLSEVNRPPIRFSDPMNLLAHLRTKHPESPGVFLITNCGQKTNSQTIEMQDGSGVKIKSDQVTNPDAVIVRLGGVLDEGIVVATSINTTGETLVAVQNFKVLKKLVLAQAVYMQGFYVMKGAERKLRDGWRLTPDPGFSREMDLALPAR